MCPPQPCSRRRGYFRLHLRDEPKVPSQTPWNEESELGGRVTKPPTPSAPSTLGCKDSVWDSAAGTLAACSCVPPTTEWALALDSKCRGRNGGSLACWRGYVGYKMTGVRDDELALCHSEYREWTLPHTRKLTGTKGKIIWRQLQAERHSLGSSVLGLSLSKAWAQDPRPSVFSLLQATDLLGILSRAPQ